jgi:tRNA nucleotidyltransferase (CCA-adding enzyme)
MEEQKILSKINSEPAISFIPEFLRDNEGAQLFLVGGAVRDSLMGRKIKDFDFVIRNLETKKIEQWFASRGKIDFVGERFGVYKFMPDGFSHHDIELIDIALPRTEKPLAESMGGYRDFEVQSNSNLPIENDLSRRDFTINAMAFDLRDKILIDPFDGRRDIELGVIRTVGAARERFSEDMTRLLRAIRFSTQLGFEIDEDTSLAIRDLIPKINSSRERDGKKGFVVSREMIGEELYKTFSADPSFAAQQLRSLGVLRELFPLLSNTTTNDQSYLDPILKAQANEPHVIFALLLRGLDEEQIEQAIKFAGLDRLSKTTRMDSKRVAWLSAMLKIQTTADAVNSMPASAFENGFMGNHGLARVRCLELVGQTATALAATTRRKKIESIWLVDETETIAPLLSGNDIVSLGIRPGPEVRRILNLLRDEQLDGHLLSREAALKWVKEKT